MHSDTNFTIEINHGSAGPPTTIGLIRIMGLPSGRFDIVGTRSSAGTIINAANASEAAAQLAPASRGAILERLTGVRDTIAELIDALEAEGA